MSVDRVLKERVIVSNVSNFTHKITNIVHFLCSSDNSIAVANVCSEFTHHTKRVTVS